MSDSPPLTGIKTEVQFAVLPSEIHEALAQRAEHSGRTIDEEAEHIIRTYLAGASTAADA